MRIKFINMALIIFLLLSVPTESYAQQKLLEDKFINNSEISYPDANYLYQDNHLYENHAGKFSFTVPLRWSEIPNNVVVDFFDQLKNLFPQFMGNNKFETAFQINSEKYFEYPYFLVRYDKVETLGKSELLKLLTNEDIKPFEDLSVLLNNVEYGKPEYDLEKNRFYFSLEADYKEVGKVKGFVTAFIGKEGIAWLYFYSKKDDIQSNLPIFKEIIDSFNFDKGYEFQPPKAQSTAKKGTSREAVFNDLYKLVKRIEVRTNDKRVQAMIQFLGSVAKKYETDFGQMYKEIGELHIDTMLSRQTLEKKETIEVAKNNIVTLRSIFDRYEKLLITRIGENELEIKKLPIPLVLREEMLKSYLSSKEKSLNSVDKFWETERAFADQVNEILVFMGSIEGKYHYEGEKLIFNTQKDVDTYNKYVTNLREISAQEQGLIDDFRQKAQESLKKVETIFAPFMLANKKSNAPKK